MKSVLAVRMPSVAVLVKVPHCVGVTVMVTVPVPIESANILQITVPSGVPGGGGLIRQPSGSVVDTDSKSTLAGNVSERKNLLGKESVLVRMTVKVRGCPTLTGLGLAILSKQSCPVRGGSLVH